MVNEKSRLRQEMKDADNANRQRVSDLMQFYENQLQQMRANNEQR